MTLLDKLTHSYKSGLALLLIPFFFACDDPSELGLELNAEDNEFETKKIEFVLPTSTIAIDSLRTDQFAASLVGKYNDPVTGSVEAISYNNYNIDGGQLPDEGDSLKFSRAFVRMKIFDSRLDQPLSGEVINIHLAQDTLFDNAVYLASRSIPYDEDPVGTVTYDFTPERDTIMEIPLTDEFGLFLFDRLDKVTNPGGDYIDSLTQGLYHYDPLVFVPGATNQGIIGFDLNADTSALYVEMIDNAGNTSYYAFDFRDKHYNQIIRDRSSSQLSDLTSEYTPSNNATQNSSIDMLAGVYAKVDLQPLIDFIESGNTLIVNNATVQYEAVEPTSEYTENLSLLNSFFITGSGRINGPGGQTANAGAFALLTEGSYLAGGSDLLTASPDSVLTYSSNISLFTQILFDNYRLEESYLAEQFVLTSPRTLSMNQTTLINSEVKLTLYYTSIKK